MKQTFPRHINALKDVVRFIDEFALENLSGDVVPVVQLVVEEIFTNMVRHNADSPADIELQLSRIDESLTIQITDLESDRFDLREQAAVDVTAPLKDRKPGGLGIHLVKHMVDEIHYRYKGGESIVTLIKKLS